MDKHHDKAWLADACLRRKLFPGGACQECVHPTGLRSSNVGPEFSSSDPKDSAYGRLCDRRFAAKGSLKGDVHSNRTGRSRATQDVVQQPSHRLVLSIWAAYSPHHPPNADNSTTKAMVAMEEPETAMAAKTSNR